jgi:hypothetical protein
MKNIVDEFVVAVHNWSRENDFYREMCDKIEVDRLKNILRKKLARDWVRRIQIISFRKDIEEYELTELNEYGGDDGKHTEEKRIKKRIKQIERRLNQALALTNPYK